MYRASDCAFCLRKRTLYSCSILRNHWNHIVVWYLNEDIQKCTRFARKKPLGASRALSAQLELNQYQSIMGPQQKCCVSHKSHWSLGIVDHIKAKNHHSSSVTLSSCFPACVTSTACSFTSILSHKAARCIAISITQHPSNSWWLLRHYLHYSL